GIADKIEFKVLVDFLLKGRRAVLYPVVKGTHERGVPPGIQRGTKEHASLRVRQVQDVRRAVDYLESRPDIDGERIAFSGFSWGGGMANLVLAVEPRFKAGIVQAGGLEARARPPRPEVDYLHYAPRVRVPVLMVHGRYDLAIPLESEARPMFDLLATPAAHKRLLVVESDHFLPRAELVREVLRWLDTHLGPVAPTAAGGGP
ncbi:MAG TPA: prolyl oligopeptidase family serine peptidase, partial [Vicinamibacteria bacterium]|nr:prolyl oligopeptidase family serine peptidase [Vicinamibacteria bacterium]